MTTAWAVAAYFTDRQYGGPEEGGWWYTTYELSHVEWWYHDEDAAWEHARRFNEDQAADRYSTLSATVIEVPRDELLPEYRDHACHGDIDDLCDEEGTILPEYRHTRWDIPVYMPETRPHYC